MKDLLEVSQLAVDVALPLPLGLFTYRVPPALEAQVQMGARVRVPFKNREMVGYLVAKKETPSQTPLKDIIEILDPEPVLSPSILELTQWVSQYYGSSWGEALENALPRWVKYGKKAQAMLAREKSSAFEISETPVDLSLTEDQQKALLAIRAALENPARRPILLHGVTGSGKSEIYIRAIREVLGRGKSAICLVPEIALTEQLRRFFLKHFGHQLEILHSRLGDGERFLAWNRIERGERRIVLGPRSAIFAPVVNLGLILIDEEHEGSYKQETAPRYHAREVAAWRAQNENALLIMGTATPSLEVMHQTQTGAVERIDLTTRVEARAMPEVQLIDLKSAMADAKKAVILTPRLIAEIETNLKKKEGTLLLLNRRGFATHIHCPQCSWVESCRSCQVSLTFHQENETLLCHYCNYSKPVPEICSHCKSPLLRFAGFGTEKVESEVARRFPAARVARMDADSVRQKGSHEKILGDFREHRIDILIGTQMIAKGFDFPHVTLVGVILADVGLSLPDFRSAERTFQLLTQVAGRAGRGKLAGRVLIQTFSPNHPSIRFAKNHDYLSFYAHESLERSQYRYPPFSQLINFIVRSRTEKKAMLFARELRDHLQQKLAADQLQNLLEIIGPAPLPFYRLRGHFRWHVMIKAPHSITLPLKMNAYLAALKKPSQVAMAMDVDPLNIL